MPVLFGLTRHADTKNTRHVVREKSSGLAVRDQVELRNLALHFMGNRLWLWKQGRY